MWQARLFTSVNTGFRHKIERQDCRENPDRDPRMSTSNRAWSTNPAPFSSHKNYTPPIALYVSLSLYTILGRIQYALNMCYLRSYTSESNSTPASQELDFHLLNLLQELFRKVFFVFFGVGVENGSEIIQLC